jgi:hypothetical protein
VASRRTQARRGKQTAARLVLLASLSLVLSLALGSALTSCSPAATPGQATAAVAQHARRSAHSPVTVPSRAAAPTRTRVAQRPPGSRPETNAASPLPAPPALAPFGAGRPAFAGEGTWHPAGRLVDGVPAIYETNVVPPGGSRRAGIAWMDTRLLSARLYSGSVSPGAGPYRFTAPIQRAQAASLVAAFNGGFKMSDAHGGYYTEGRVIDPLAAGAASLVIYADGSVTVGAWGTDVVMTPNVTAVRQNLVPLVADGRPTKLAASGDWRAWGNTCGARSCAASVPGIEHQWRSAVGVTADGALVYAAGPGLDPLQVATLLVHANVVRGMELDINPSWPVFVSYDPATPHGIAAPSNGGKLLSTTRQGPWTFFNPLWPRDFITMSARPAP